MNNRQYSTRWTDDITSKFIDARIKDLFTGRFFNNKESWEKVGSDCGLQDEWQRLRKKWFNIMDKYKKIIKPPTGTGTDNNCVMANNWPFFDKIHEYATNKYNIYPALLIESCPNESTSTMSTSSSGGTDSNSSIGTRETIRSSERSETSGSNAKKLRTAVMNVADVFLQFMELKYGIIPTNNNSNIITDSESE